SRARPADRGCTGPDGGARRRGEPRPHRGGAPRGRLDLRHPHRAPARLGGLQPGPLAAHHQRHPAQGDEAMKRLFRRRTITDDQRRTLRWWLMLGLIPFALVAIILATKLISVNVLSESAIDRFESRAYSQGAEAAR